MMARLYFSLDIVFLKKQMGHLQPLFHSFSSIQTNITIFTPNKCEKCPSSVQCWDSNPQPSRHESPHITTRPGLPRPVLNVLSSFQSVFHLLALYLSVFLCFQLVLSQVLVPFLFSDSPVCQNVIIVYWRADDDDDDDDFCQWEMDLLTTAASECKDQPGLRGGIE